MARRAIITGANGTVGSRLASFLRQQGCDVIPWNRGIVPVDNYAAMERFVRESAPEVVFHLATASQPTGRPGESWLVNYEWASELAWITRILGIRFVFTSTVTVFSNHAHGPFTLDSQPDATEGYGYEKRRAEERVFYQNPEARVARLGWQIGEQTTGNNMVAFLEEKMRQEGVVRASTRWYPASAILDDTVQALHTLSNSAPGLYQLDANERWTFYEIVRALNVRHKNRWKVESTEDFVFDQRMKDERIRLPLLKERLPWLP
ncbi:sugar nucleotide-binding protein [Hyalangium versicolor]|uniref:sugar nucleotide-binding protein n=1 Tax=Hyalangium versicolor TaxID=2861190 RepID=UPI001CC9FC71|nr:sugar nucleotide-binding protein [Hyalangium versicolor]